MTILLVSLVTFAALSVSAVPARAGLVGASAHFSHDYPAIGSETVFADAVVGAGVEFTTANGYSIDVGDNSIDILFIASPGFLAIDPPYPSWNGPVIRGLTLTRFPAITGLSGFATTVPGYTASLIQFDATSVAFQFGGAVRSFQQGQTIHIGLNFASVPEVSSFYFAGVSVMSLAIMYGWSSYERSRRRCAGGLPRFNRFGILRHDDQPGFREALKRAVARCPRESSSRRNRTFASPTKGRLPW